MREKRVVLEYLSGTRKGLRSILGLVNSETDLYPASLNSLAELAGGSAIHAGTKPCYVLYREWVSPAKGVLGEFHPQQR